MHKHLLHSLVSHEDELLLVLELVEDYLLILIMITHGVQGH